MYVWQYVATSVALTVAVTAKALAVYPNFYSAMLSISDNSASLCVIVNQLLCILWFIGRLIVWMVFGELRLAEIEFIYQKVWFLAIDGVFIAGSLSTREPAYDFGLLIALIGALLVFHWVLQKRSSVLFRMIDLPTKFQFIRIYLFTAALIYIDVRLCSYGWGELLRGNKMVTLLTSHFVDLLQISIRSMCVLCLDFYEAYVADIEEDDQWEPKDKIMLGIRFALELGSFLVYGIICYTLGSFSFHMLFGVADKAHKLYAVVIAINRMRMATSNLDSFVSVPTPEDIARDNCCVICREEMDLDAPSDRLKPKKMKCGHVIHIACLKSWLGRSQNCPTCRQPVKGATSAFVSRPATQLPPGLAEAAVGQAFNQARQPATAARANQPAQTGPATQLNQATTGTAPTAAATATAGGSRPGSRPGSGPRNAMSRPGSPENAPIDTSNWKRFPTRDTSTGQEVRLGDVWYEFTVL